MVVNQLETQEALQQMETLLLPRALQGKKWEWTWTNHRRLQKRKIPNKKTGMRMNERCLTHLVLLTRILFCYLNNTFDAVVALYAFRKKHTMDGVLRKTLSKHIFSSSSYKVQ